MGRDQHKYMDEYRPGTSNGSTNSPGGEAEDFAQRLPRCVYALVVPHSCYFLAALKYIKPHPNRKGTGPAGVNVRNAFTR